MARRISLVEMFRQLNRPSSGDMAVLEDEALLRVLIANAEPVASKEIDVAQA